MDKDSIKYGNLIAFIAVVVFNVFATFGILGGITTREVSYMYKSLLTPADYAFSIWGVIYILLAVMVLRQIKRNNLNGKAGNLFIISCLLNIFWIITWQFKQIFMSFIIIVALLVDLLVLMKVMRDSDTISKMSIGLYTGWINVAMLANLGTVFARYAFRPLGLNQSVWAVIGLTFGFLWISMFIILYGNVFYAVGACWGYIGILINSSDKGVSILTIIGIVFFTAGIIYGIIKNKSIDVEY